MQYKSPHLCSGASELLALHFGDSTVGLAFIHRLAVYPQYSIV